MRLIDADAIYPWYVKAFSVEEIGEERAIQPEEVRFSMRDIKENLNNIPTVKQETKTDILDKIRAEIETIIGEHNLDDYDFCSGLICARKIIDKYRKQEPKTDILDKIRTEIDSIKDTMGVSYNQYLSKIEVLRIIDKYKTESGGANDK